MWLCLCCCLCPGRLPDTCTDDPFDGSVNPGEDRTNNSEGTCLQISEGMTPAELFQLSPEAAASDTLRISPTEWAGILGLGMSEAANSSIFLCCPHLHRSAALSCVAFRYLQPSCPRSPPPLPQAPAPLAAQLLARGRALSHLPLRCLPHCAAHAQQPADSRQRRPISLVPVM
jgi:hypothetical protein